MWRLSQSRGTPASEEPKGAEMACLALFKALPKDMRVRYRTLRNLHFLQTGLFPRSRWYTYSCTETKDTPLYTWKNTKVRVKLSSQGLKEKCLEGRVLTDLT